MNFKQPSKIIGSFVILSAALCLSSCDVPFSPAGGGGGIFKDPRNENIIITISSVEPPTGTALQTGDTVAITASYSIPAIYVNQIEKAHLILNNQEDLGCRDLNSRTGSVSFTVIITDQFLNSHGSPNMFHIRIEAIDQETVTEFFPTYSYNNSSTVTYYW